MELSGDAQVNTALAHVFGTDYGVETTGEDNSWDGDLPGSPDWDKSERHSELAAHKDLMRAACWSYQVARNAPLRRNEPRDCRLPQLA